MAGIVILAAAVALAFGIGLYARYRYAVPAKAEVEQKGLETTERLVEEAERDVKERGRR